MNIIAGIYKGRTIKSPNDPNTHPMGSREKLALFNMLLPYLPSSVVLDAFAGSGAVGLECLSRGASEVVFLEKSPSVARIIRENCTFLPDKNAYNIVVSSVESFHTEVDFDLIIADPPYDLFTPELVSPLLAFLKPSGIFALSHPKTLVPPSFPGLTLIKSRSYASASISLYQKV